MLSCIRPFQICGMSGENAAEYWSAVPITICPFKIYEWRLLYSQNLSEVGRKKSNIIVNDDVKMERCYSLTYFAGSWERQSAYLSSNVHTIIVASQTWERHCTIWIASHDFMLHVGSTSSQEATPAQIENSILRYIYTIAHSGFIPPLNLDHWQSLKAHTHTHNPPFSPRNNIKWLCEFLRLL